MAKSIFILIALALGLLLPQLDAYTFTLRPFLMILLFFSFLNVRLDGNIFSRQQAYVALLLPFIGLTAYYLGGLFGQDLALTLLLMGLAPTAIITPVLAGLMRRRAGYLVGAIIVTHAIYAMTIPLLLPRLLGVELSLGELGVLVWTIGSTVAAPLVLAQIARRLGDRLMSGLRRLSPFTFLLYLSNVTVASGSLSYYVRHEAVVPWHFMGLTTVCIGLLLLCNFFVGSRCSPSGHAVEGSLALGQKNTMLSIWVALEYINPLVVLGPMAYILLQNTFVAGQIMYLDRQDRHSAAVPLEP